MFSLLPENIFLSMHAVHNMFLLLLQIKQKLKINPVAVRNP